MEEIYWIQRLGVLNTASMVILVIASFALLFFILFKLIGGFEDLSDELVSRVKRFIRISLTAVVISSIGVIFIPTQRELYAIYGIGGTIDYIKSNDTAKQLPDKVVNALDKWIDDKTKEDKE